MGMFDWYEPVPPLSCPACGRALDGWQGKDGPNALFVWKQRHPNPVGQLVDEECKLDETQRAAYRLPDEFGFYTQCVCDRWIQAEGHCKNGVWSDTRLVTPEL
jgi:hypothetical protein